MHFKCILRNSLLLHSFALFKNKPLWGWGSGEEEAAKRGWEVGGGGREPLNGNETKIAHLMKCWGQRFKPKQAELFQVKD